MLKKLLNWGFKYNVWIFFHMGAGAVGAKIGLLFFNRWESFFIITALAVLWEVFEFFYDGGVDGMIKIYGSLDRWWFDSLGDVIGASLMGFVVVI